MAPPVDDARIAVAIDNPDRQLRHPVQDYGPHRCGHRCLQSPQQGFEFGPLERVLSGAAIALVTMHA
jgi:hypothetical protein